MRELVKKIVRPVQIQFLRRGLCVACGMPLSKAERIDRGNGTEKIVCKCSRIFIYDMATNTYRRANFDEA